MSNGGSDSEHGDNEAEVVKPGTVVQDSEHEQKHRQRKIKKKKMPSKSRGKFEKSSYAAVLSTIKEMFYGCHHL